MALIPRVPSGQPGPLSPWLPSLCTAKSPGHPIQITPFPVPSLYPQNRVAHPPCLISKPLHGQVWFSPQLRSVCVSGNLSLHHPNLRTAGFQQRFLRSVTFLRLESRDFPPIGSCCIVAAVVAFVAFLHCDAFSIPPSPQRPTVPQVQMLQVVQMLA